MVKPTAPFPTHHPLVQNPDGSHSNVRTMTVGINDRTYVLPSMVGGKQLEEEEAIRLAERRGLQNYPSFATHDKAEQWIEQHHGSQDPAANAPMRGWYSRQKGGAMPEEEELLEEQRKLRLRALLDEAEQRESQSQSEIAAARRSIQEQQQQIMLDRLAASAQRESTPERVLQEDIRRLAPSPEADMQRRRQSRSARQVRTMRREQEQQEQDHRDEVQALRRGAGASIAAQARRAAEAERRAQEAEAARAAQSEETASNRLQALFARMRGM